MSDIEISIPLETLEKIDDLDSVLDGIQRARGVDSVDVSAEDTRKIDEVADLPEERLYERITAGDVNYEDILHTDTHLIGRKLWLYPSLREKIRHGPFEEREDYTAHAYYDGEVMKGRVRVQDIPKNNGRIQFRQPFMDDLELLVGDVVRITLFPRPTSESAAKDFEV